MSADLTGQRAIGHRIRVARVETGWSQRDLGQRLVPSRSHAAVSNIERGRTAITTVLIDQLSVLLRKPFGYFLGVETADITETVTIPTARYRELLKAEARMLAVKMVLLDERDE